MNITNIINLRVSRVEDFRFVIHRCEKTEDLLLDPKGFYALHGKKPMVFPHYEVEVLNHKGLPPQAHCIKGVDGRGFICWPMRTPTKADAMKLLEGWSAAVLVTLTTKEDANLILGRLCPAEKQLRHLESMADILGVKVEHFVSYKTD